MEALLERRDRDGMVQERRHGDGHDVQRVVLEQLLPVGDVALNAVLGGERRAHGLLEPGDPGELHAG
jgi:hypothetical protein